ncbi:hypothetical protein [Psychrobacter piechaudii]|uniref:Lipoprotein n=1 Tax=Psychrobacter piechaudii TaxID=1945521 RepID=A0A1R4GUI5_9GAMM|nr:hypothetical protein [Psychrobacter piechaudii]SJM71858.1 hypothetical protein A1232T_01385 [Psychrobacter piechaudii]
MKKSLAVSALMASLALSGCTTTGTGTDAGNAVGTATNVGMNIFKTAVDAQCRSELEKQNAWRIARVAMNSEQEEAVKTKICGCVSEQAPQQVTVVDMTNAAIDPQYRAQLVTKVVAKSLQTCYASFTK